MNRIQFAATPARRTGCSAGRWCSPRGAVQQEQARLSKYKINQLGYFEVKDEPIIQTVEGENRVNVVLAGEEKGRNEIQVGGGYSGSDGAFFTGFYSTRTFMGRGQIFSASVQLAGAPTATPSRSSSPGS